MSTQKGTTGNNASTLESFAASPWKLASFGELDALRTLVAAGAKMDEQDDMGFTPVCW